MQSTWSKLNCKLRVGDNDGQGGLLNCKIKKTISPIFGFLGFRANFCFVPSCYLCGWMWSTPLPFDTLQHNTSPGGWSSIWQRGSCTNRLYPCLQPTRWYSNGLHPRKLNPRLHVLSPRALCKLQLQLLKMRMRMRMRMILMIEWRGRVWALWLGRWGQPSPLIILWSTTSSSSSPTISSQLSSSPSSTLLWGLTWQQCWCSSHVGRCHASWSVRWSFSFILAPLQCTALNINIWRTQK